MAKQSSGASWAVPTQKIMTNAAKKTKVLGYVAPIVTKKPAKKFNAGGSYTKAKKKVFGM